VASFEPHVSQTQIASLTKSSTYRLQVKASHVAGEITSGIGSFVLANVPEKPEKAVNDATSTNG
jgi:hypothetical protein